MSQSNGRLPNFLYIGPDKAGSSWLHEVLLLHDDVFLSEAKDLYFFDRYYERGLDWYRQQFRHAGQQRVVGEVCQDYLFHPDAAKRIRHDLGEIRLMVTLREPAARAHSSYLYMLKQGQQVGTFHEALAARPELLDHGRYGSALERYLEQFPADNLHIGLFDQLQNDPQAFLDQVTGWLGVDVLPLTGGQLAARLPAGRARSRLLARLARAAADWTREHDGAELVGRVKRSRHVQRALYRPLGPAAPKLRPRDVDLVWELLGAEMDRVHELTGVDVRKIWR